MSSVKNAPGENIHSVFNQNKVVGFSSASKGMGTKTKNVNNMKSLSEPECLQIHCSVAKV